MARLLVDGHWYDAVSSQSWYEQDYERLLVNRAPDIFPTWLCAIFRETVEGDDGSRKQPDLALIDRYYRRWWVVEVELAHHDLYGHVLPQVDAFRTGSYDHRHAQALARSRTGLDLHSLEQMMRGDPPNVLVVVDSPSTGWAMTLRDHGAYLAVAEPFRNSQNHLIIRSNGYQPPQPSEVLSRCSRHPQLRRLWRVTAPAALPTADILAIEFRGTVSHWRRVTIQDAVMLQAERGDVLLDISAADLVRHEDGGLRFVPIQRLSQRKQFR